MRSRSLSISIFIVLTALFIPLILSAGEFGKIVGRVTDKATGQPIVGVSVLIVGTTQGIMTDVDGRFVISNIKPGDVTLKLTSVSYITFEISTISISADLTTEVNIEMEKSTTDLKKVIKVTADRDIIDRYCTSSSVIIQKDHKQQIPVRNVDELLKETAGVIAPDEEKILIRGGRAGEASYIVDGVDIGDPLGGYSPSIVREPKDRPGKPNPNCYLPPPPPPYYWPSIVNGQTYDAMFFKDYGTNPFVFTEDDHLSTFAIDVDDASYVMARSYLERGTLPPDEAIRTEEFINRFHYNYGQPDEGPFSVNIEGAPSKFGQNCELMRIGIQGDDVGRWERKPANLVFVIDVSGSMNREDRLGLVKRALNMLVDNLENDDRVGIVVYGSNAREIIRPTSVRDSWRIHDAINRLQPGGSTNAEQGLRLGYRMAEHNFRKGCINRVILCSDGVANVGQTNAEELLREIKPSIDRGITLSTIGFGMGNYNDILMEKLGDKGNGNYAYVDDFSEARRVFMENLTGMLQVIARDVKIQVDFNPSVVSSYRLLGYENRDVADNKFRDDREDGGEIGSGHQVTALYEVRFKDEYRSDHVASVFIRYKHPDQDIVDEQSYTIKRNHFSRRFDNCSSDFKLAAAAAEFGEILGKSYWARNSKLDDVRKVVRDVMRQNDSREVVELMDLISKAERFADQLAER